MASSGTRLGDKLAAMMASKGVDRSQFRAQVAIAPKFNKRGVQASAELERIRQLPRYRWQDDPELELLTDQLTAWLKTPNGTMRLKTTQAAILQAAHDWHGAMGPIRVGGGKTLASYLMPVVMDAKRPLLLVPAKLRDKTLREFSRLSVHWRGHARMAIMSYELLGRDRGIAELEALQPDLIIADEAHKLRNPKPAVTKRVRRYLAEREQAGQRCAYVDLSGTTLKRSIMEAHQRARWALTDKRLPIPQPWPEAQEWAQALDAKVPLGKRLAPGALLTLCDDSELDRLAKGDLAAVRDAFRRRFTEVPGVVATQESDDGGVALIVRERRLDLPQVVYADFDRLRTEWETPDGHPFTEPVELRRHARELVLGFFYRWDPAAPPEWLAARRAWCAFARETLSGSRTYDTEMQVARACARGELDDYCYREWIAVRDSFKPKTSAVWTHDAALKDAAAWLAEGPGIVWAEHVAFGEKLSQVAGVPYFGRLGRDAEGRLIDDYTGPCIASIEANKEGRNLQFAYSRNYVSSSPPGGDVWEQMVGRTHRDGQDADEVTFDVVLGCWEQWADFRQAVRDGEFSSAALGQAHKLTIADMEIPSDDEIGQRWHDPLWRKRG